MQVEKQGQGPNPSEENFTDPKPKLEEDEIRFK